MDPCSKSFVPSNLLLQPNLKEVADDAKKRPTPLVGEALNVFFSKLNNTKIFGKVFKFSLFEFLQEFYTKISTNCDVHVELVGGGLLWLLGKEYFHSFFQNRNEDEIRNLQEILNKPPHDFDIRICLISNKHNSVLNPFELVEQIFLEILKKKANIPLNEQEIIANYLKNRKIIRSDEDYFSIFSLEGVGDQISLDVIFAISLKREYVFIRDALKLNCTAFFSSENNPVKCLFPQLPSSICFSTYLNDLFSKTLSLRPDKKIFPEDGVILWSKITRNQQRVDEKTQQEIAEAIKRLVPKETIFNELKNLILRHESRFKTSLGFFTFFWNILHFFHRYQIADYRLLSNLWDFFCTHSIIANEKEWITGISGILQCTKNDWGHCFALDQLYAFLEALHFCEHPFRKVTSFEILDSKFYCKTEEKASLVYPVSMEETITHLKQIDSIPANMQYSLKHSFPIRSHSILSQTILNQLSDWISHKEKSFREMGVVIQLSYFVIEKNEEKKTDLFFYCLKNMFPILIENRSLTSLTLDVAAYIGLLQSPIPEIPPLDLKSWDFLFFLNNFSKESFLERWVGQFLKGGNAQYNFFENVLKLAETRPRIALMILLETSAKKSGESLINYWQPILELSGKMPESLEKKMHLYPSLLKALEKIVKILPENFSFHSTQKYLKKFFYDCIEGPVVLDVKPFLKEVIAKKAFDSYEEDLRNLWVVVLKNLSVKEKAIWLTEGMQRGISLKEEYMKFIVDNRSADNFEPLVFLSKNIQAIKDFPDLWFSLASQWFEQELFSHACPIFGILYDRIDPASSLFLTILKKAKKLTYLHESFLVKILEEKGREINRFYLKEKKIEDIFFLGEAYKVLGKRPDASIELKVIEINYNKEESIGAKAFEKWMQEQKQLSLEEETLKILYPLLKKQGKKDYKSVISFLKNQEHFFSKDIPLNQELFIYFLDAFKSNIDTALEFIHTFQVNLKSISSEILGAVFLILINKKEFKLYYLEKVIELLLYFNINSLEIWQTLFPWVKQSSKNTKDLLIHWFLTNCFPIGNTIPNDKKNQLWSIAYSCIEDLSEYHFPLIEAIFKNNAENFLSEENLKAYLRFSFKFLSKNKNSLGDKNFPLDNWMKNLHGLFQNHFPLEQKIKTQDWLEMHISYVDLFFESLNIQELMIQKAEHLLKLFIVCSDEKMRFRLILLVNNQLNLLSKIEVLNKEQLYDFILQTIDKIPPNQIEMNKNLIILLVKISQKESMKKAKELFVENLVQLKQHTKDSLFCNTLETLVRFLYEETEIKDLFFLFSKKEFKFFLKKDIFIDLSLKLILKKILNKNLDEIFPVFENFLEELINKGEEVPTTVYENIEKLFQIVSNFPKKTFFDFFESFFEKTLDAKKCNAIKIKCHFFSIASDYIKKQSFENLTISFLKKSYEHLNVFCKSENHIQINKWREYIKNHLQTFFPFLIKYQFQGHEYNDVRQRIIPHPYAFWGIISQTFKLELITQTDYFNYHLYFSSFKPKFAKDFMKFFSIKNCCEAGTFLFQYIKQDNVQLLNTPIDSYTHCLEKFEINEFKIFVSNTLKNFYECPYLLWRDFVEPDGKKKHCLELFEAEIKKIEETCIKVQNEESNRILYEIWEEFVTLFFVHFAKFRREIEINNYLSQNLALTIRLPQYLFKKAETVLDSTKFEELIFLYIDQLIGINSSITDSIYYLENHTNEFRNLCEEIQQKLSSKGQVKIKIVLKNLITFL